MRKKILAGNWKMNTSIDQGWKLYQDVQNGWKKIGEEGLLCVIAPPYTHIPQFASIIQDHSFLAAQDCSEYETGAHTGEISAEMIKSVGATYVIIGHSERRLKNMETGEQLQLKIDQALNSGLAPIFCCGESQDDRENGNHEAVVIQQLTEGLFHLTAEQFGKVVVAYEPVWAIGTGQTATPAQAQDMHGFIRAEVAKKYNEEVAENLSILYGGSCNPQNADELFANKDIDGGLIGGASLVSDDFINIGKSLKGKK